MIIRMGSEATPLDRVRGWRRGFDAIAEYFLLAREPLPSSPPEGEKTRLVQTLPTDTYNP